MERPRVVTYLPDRQLRDKYTLAFQRKLHVTDDLVMRLGLEKELQGHVGCVNCLEWNEQGTLLASGSDDTRIILWDPFKHRKLQCIQSGHHGNIFSVKFLPNCKDGMLVSGAADYKIRVHDVEGRETTMACSCHAGRVKRVAVAPNVPFMFWSAAEDGLIMQFDMRIPHQCSSGCNTVLINLIHHIGRNAEAKCLAINPLRPELLAVGANDPFIRLYDRRMIKPTTIKYPNEHVPRSPWERQNYMANSSESENDNLAPECVKYFVAGHLPLKQLDYKKRYRTLASTYLAFSPDGAEILANLGGEQIYLFNINKPSKPKTFDMLNGFTHNGFCKDSTNGYHKNGTTSSNGISSAHLICKSLESGSLCSVSNSRKVGKILSPLVEAIKTRANEKFGQQQYTVAINLYNQAIARCPDAAVLYACRAAALIKRAWDGDIYAALRDCHSALHLDSDYAKAYFHMATCLYELHWNREAMDCLQVFKRKFPDLAKSHTYEALDRDIKAANTSRKENGSEDSSSSSSSSGGSGSSSSKSEGHPSGPSCCKAPLSEQEKIWRDLAFDYGARFCGHCNTTTDIKEANFFGSSGQYIVAGSDDGSFFMWNRLTTNIVRVLRGDDSIVNCLQPHPTTCVLATSGIDPVVRLWSPRPEDGSSDDREVLDSEDAAVANQKRMNADPLEVMLMNMGYRIPGFLDADALEVHQEGGGREVSIAPCRPS